MVLVGVTGLSIVVRIIFVWGAAEKNGEVWIRRREVFAAKEGIKAAVNFTISCCDEIDTWYLWYIDVLSLLLLYFISSAFRDEVTERGKRWSAISITWLTFSTIHFVITFDHPHNPCSRLFNIFQSGPWKLGKACHKAGTHSLPKHERFVFSTTRPAQAWKMYPQQPGNMSCSNWSESR